MDSAEVLRRIKEMNKASGRSAHALYQALESADLNLEQLRHVCRQLSIIPLHNHNYHGRLYVSCPDPAWRERIAEVAYEEATGRIYANGVGHYKLYLAYAKAIGISEEEMWSVEYCPSALGLRLFLSDTCSRFIEGVSASMLVGEAQVPGSSGRIARALKAKFGLSEDEVAFFTVHDTADGDHSATGIDILERFVKTDAERALVLETARQSNVIRKLMYDEIWEHAQSLK